eukprot:7970864-Alexandrium_andersonii.AAC.1
MPRCTSILQPWHTLQRVQSEVRNEHPGLSMHIGFKRSRSELCGPETASNSVPAAAELFASVGEDS